MTNTNGLTEAEQDLVNKLEKESTSTLGGLSSYIAAISENAGSAIELNDALTADRKNGRVDDTARVGLKIAAGIGIGALMMPFVVASGASLATIAVGSALVYYASSVAGNLIDSLWDSGKDFFI